LVALAYRPELLLLDEPSSGLDPIVRRDILGAIVRTIADEGRTVLFSSHLLDEVERISDRVAMLKGGRIVFAGALDEIKQTHHRLTLRFDGERNQAPALDGVLSWEGRGREWTAVASGRLDALRLAASAAGAEVVGQKALSLDEIFLAQVGQPGQPGQPPSPSQEA
jgi:ABC-2 type transport system ATP-binding protein